MTPPYGTADRAVDIGRMAGHEADHGLATLRQVVTDTDTTDAVSWAFLFGFVDGLSQVWEAVNLIDFIPGGAT